MPDELGTVDIAGDDGQYDGQTGENMLGTPPTDEEQPLEKSPEQYEEEIAGLKKTLTSEREKRQSQGGRIDELTNQIAYLHQMQLQNNAASSEPVDEFDDDYISKKDLRKQKEEITGQIDNGFQAILTLSEKVARIKYPDYEEVLMLYKERQAGNPRLARQVLDSVDPAEEAYQIGRQHPDYYETAIKKQTQMNADRMNRNSEKPSTLTDTGATSTAAAAEEKRINDMSLDSINDILEGNARGIKKR